MKNIHDDNLQLKLQSLPTAQRAQAEDLMDFLLTRQQNDRVLAQDAVHASGQAFNRVWDNDQDAAYDAR